VELPFTVAFEAPSLTTLRAVLRLRRTWLAGHLGLLAIGIMVAPGALRGVWSFGRADASDARLIMLGLAKRR